MTQLTFTDAAKVLGVSYPRLCRSWTRLPDFPAPISRKKKGLVVFDQAAVLRYAEQYPVKTLVDDIINSGHEPEPITPFNAMALQLIRGDLLPPEQKAALDFKKLVARTTQPKTRRETLKPEWWYEDFRGKRERNV